MSQTNPRSKNGHRRRQVRARLLASADHCALCGQVIDKTLKTPHPLSPEIDEIIPISLGGSPIELSNLQLTHRICNQKKSNKVLSRTTVRSPIRLSRIW